jgi:excisionase family DNA binding protein
VSSPQRTDDLDVALSNISAVIGIPVDRLKALALGEASSLFEAAPPPEASQGRASEAPRAGGYSRKRRELSPITHLTPFDDLPTRLSVDEVAAWLRQNRNVVYDAVLTGQLPSARVAGNRIQIPKEALRIPVDVTPEEDPSYQPHGRPPDGYGIATKRAKLARLLAERHKE